MDKVDEVNRSPAVCCVDEEEVGNGRNAEGSDEEVPSQNPAYPARYGYRGKLGPRHWHQLNAAWKISKQGVHQSPVDLKFEHTVEDESMVDISYDYHYDHSVKLINDGLLPMYFFTPKMHHIAGGPLKHQYELVQYHFHFSRDQKHGSEHALNGETFPAEVHFVHYKTEYKSFAEALQHEDGLAVIAALLKVSASPKDVSNLHLDADIVRMLEVRHAGHTVATTLDLSKYNMAAKDYLTYQGSLTSPPCCECVQWIILREPVTISQHAFCTLTELESLEGGVIADPGNVRPLQSLNGRPIRSRLCLAQKDYISAAHLVEL